MNRTVMGLMWLVVALIASGTGLRTAHATTVDPGAFAPGTNVTGAYTGVTLLSFSLDQVGTLPSGLSLYAPSYGSVYSVDSSSFFSIGSAFGTSPSPVSSSDFAGMWGGVSGSCFTACSSPIDRPDDFGTNLLVDFASPVMSVSILDDGDVFNGVYMEAFDASDQVIGACSVLAGNIQPLGNYGCYSVLSETQGEGNYEVETSIAARPDDGISKILIGGYNNSYAISTIKYTTSAPEIDTRSAASGLTLLLGGLMVLSGRRPMKLDSAAA